MKQFLKRIINPRTIFLFLLVMILFFRFGIKISKDYPVWDYFHQYFAFQNILSKGDIYAEFSVGLPRYTRSPFFALILSPLGLLPRNISSFTWCLLTIVSLGSIFLLSEKLFFATEIKTTALWIFIAPIALLLLNRPIVSEFLMGQANLIMLCLVMLALFFKERQRLVLSALFLTLAINIKLTPLVFLLYFLFKKEFKFVSLVILFIIITLFIPAIFLSWEHNLLLLNNWLHILQHYEIYAHDTVSSSISGIQSLYIFFKRFLFSDNFQLSLFKASPLIAKYLYCLSFLVIYILIFLKPKNISRGSKTNRYIDYNILIICMIIFSPLAADHTYTNLIIPIIFLLCLYRKERLYKSPIVVLCAILVLIFSIFTSSKAFRYIGIPNILAVDGIEAGMRVGPYLVFMTLVWQALVLLFLLFYLKYKRAPDRNIS